MLNFMPLDESIRAYRRLSPSKGRIRSQDIGTLPRSWTIEALEYGIVASNTVLEARGTDNSHPSAFAFNIHEISLRIKTDDVDTKATYKVLEYTKGSSKSWSYVLEADNMIGVAACSITTKIASTIGESANVTPSW
jgi:hypothetical protein